MKNVLPDLVLTVGEWSHPLYIVDHLGEREFTSMHRQTRVRQVFKVLDAKTGKAYRWIMPRHCFNQFFLLMNRHGPIFFFSVYKSLPPVGQNAIPQYELRKVPFPVSKKELTMMLFSVS